MQDHIHSKLLYVFTKDRTSGTAENCTVNFGNTMSRNVFKVVLKEASIPNTMYNITSYNNTIIVNGTPYQVPVGKYDLASLTTALQTLLAAFTFTVVPNTTTYKLTFNTSAPVTISSRDNGSTIARILGLHKVMNITTNSYVAPHIYDLSGPSMLFLYSPELCGTNSNMMTVKGGIPAIGNFIVNAPFGEFITFEVREDMTDSIDMDNYNNIRSITLQLVNEFLEPVDLNGQDYMIIFKIFLSTHK